MSSPKPQIAFLLQMFGIGGMPKWLFRLAGQLKDEFDFHFIATHSDYFVPEYSEVARLVALPFTRWSLASYLFRNRIDIAQVANKRLYTEAARLARVPSVIERVDGLRSGAALKNKKGLDLVIASTRGIIPHLKGLISSERIRQIYNGVDLVTFREAPIERFSYSMEDVIIGRTTRLAGGKNISLLIAAVKKLREQPEYQHVRLVICGGDTTQPGAPPMLDRLMQEAADLGPSVVFTGPVLDTAPITRGFDIATCTSRPNNEGIPNSLIEAMAAGKPVVASAVDDIPELVTHRKTGLLFESDDLPGLIEALQTLIDDAKLRHQMGDEGRRRVEAEFDLVVQSEAYRQVYHELLERKGSHWLNRWFRSR